ncbi:MAG: hypothetical protein ACREA0_28730, partial [bacterium]
MSFVLLSMLSVVAIGSEIAARPTASDTELWYLVTLQGEHAGWMHVQTTRDPNEAARGEERLTTEVDWSLTVSRAGTTVTSRKKGRFVESMEGKPISMWSMQDLGSSPREAHYDFGPDEITVRITEGGRTSQTTSPLPSGEWMTPHR